MLVAHSTPSEVVSVGIAELHEKSGGNHIKPYISFPFIPWVSWYQKHNFILPLAIPFHPIKPSKYLLEVHSLMLIGH